MKISVAIVDDQQLFLRSLCTLIDTFPAFSVVADALNGEDLLMKIGRGPLPDILLMDVHMPGMNGMALAKTVAEKYPGIRMAALSMKDDDITVIKMIRAGCCAYLLKDMHPTDLAHALSDIHHKGYYNADCYNINYRRLIIHADQQNSLKLSDREKQFLRLSCSDRTYKQIAFEMHLSERTIDGYRESIFEKFNVQSRVGMVMEALKRELVCLDEEANAV